MRLREKIDALKKAQAEYHERASNLTPDQMVKEREKFKKLRNDISEAITEGAKNCPDCGNMPVGIFHDGTPSPFEIGCGFDRDHRVREALPEDAVVRWNKGDYLPPREEGTVVMTHKDLTGKTLNERVVRPRR